MRSNNYSVPEIDDASNLVINLILARLAFADHDLAIVSDGEDK